MHICDVETMTRNQTIPKYLENEETKRKTA
jgi:hypothetical protein